MEILASSISNIAKELDEKVNEFLTKLIEEEIVYLFIDATYFKVRKGARYINEAFFIEGIKESEIVSDKLRGMGYDRAANAIERDVGFALMYKGFPREHWKRIRTTNLSERINKEIKRISFGFRKVERYIKKVLLGVMPKEFIKLPDFTHEGTVCCGYKGLSFIT